MLIKHQIINPLTGFQLNPAEIKYLGSGLQRPECILAENDGAIWTADARGGVMKLNQDGTQQLITGSFETCISDDIESSSDIRHPTSEIPNYTSRYVQAQGSLPNGLCFDKEGNFIIANWGTDTIELMTREGKTKTICNSIDGAPLGKTNFPLRDSKGRIWFTVTTKENPWTNQLNTKSTDGYIALMDEKGVRIVAEGFCGTNEIRFDDKEEWLYVVESTGWNISRLRVHEDGSLTNREVYGPSKLDGFPDGFAFDAFGNLWVTLIFTDVLIAITPEGEVITILDDSNPVTKKKLFDAFNVNEITGDILGATHGTIAPWMASLTFGGADLSTVYLGSLRGTTIPYFKSPVAGQRMIHCR
jgi:sugar lactone lactonase YvrE